MARRVQEVGRVGVAVKVADGTKREIPEKIRQLASRLIDKDGRRVKERSSADAIYDTEVVLGPGDADIRVDGLDHPTARLIRAAWIR